MTVLHHRVPPGQVRDAIVKYLKYRAKPMLVTEIEAGVCSELGCRISPSSVRSYLALNTPGLFERRERGQYSLACEPQLTQRDSIAFSEFAYGKATLYKGDCLQWLAQQKSSSLHAVLTDPPYGLVEYSKPEQRKLREGRGGVWRIPPSFDGHKRSPLPRFTVLDADDLSRLREFFGRWARVLLPVLVPGANVVVASNPLLSHLVSMELSNAGFERRGELVRLVMTMRGGDRPKNAHTEFSGVTVMPRSMWEPWLVFRKPLEGRVQDNLRRWRTGGFRRPSLQRPFGDVIASSPTHKRERTLAPHPSLKPQAFLRQVARAMLPLGDGVVLDPFAGSGSTLAACEHVGYQSVGVECDSAYFNLAKQGIPHLARLEIHDGSLYSQD